MLDMIEYKDDKMRRIVPDPRLFTDEDKAVSYREGYTYLCRCAPEKELRYRFAKDLRFYPMRKGDVASEHDPSCPFSDQYEKNAAKESPIASKDELTGETKVSVFENILRPLSSYESPDTNEERGSGEKRDPDINRMRYISIIKGINLELSLKQATSFNKKIRSFYEVNRWLFMRSKEVYLDNRNEDVAINPDGNVKFIYERLEDITACTRDSKGVVREISLKELSYDAKAFNKETGPDSFKHNVVTSFVDKDGKAHTRRIFATKAAVRSAIRAAVRSAGKAAEHAYIKTEGGAVIAIGYEYDFEYKDDMGMPKTVRRLGRLYLLNVSSYGFACDDGHGALLQEVCFQIAKEADDVRFYLSSSEGDVYGVIIVDGCPLKAFIRIKGRRGPSENSSDREIKWDPDNEDRDTLKAKVCETVSEMREMAG